MAVVAIAYDIDAELAYTLVTLDKNFLPKTAQVYFCVSKHSKVLKPTQHVCFIGRK